MQTEENVLQTISENPGMLQQQGCEIFEKYFVNLNRDEWRPLKEKIDLMLANLKKELKALLKDNNGKSFYTECKKLSNDIVIAGSFLSGFGNTVKKVDINALSSNIPMHLGASVLETLVTRITELLSKKFTNFSDKCRAYERLMLFVEIYCRFSSLKNVLFLYYYAFLFDSLLSQNIRLGILRVISAQKDRNKSLLEFLWKPSTSTAIFHFIGNVSDREFMKSVLIDHHMELDELSHLSTGTYRFRPLSYSDGFVYMADLPRGLKFIRWSRSVNVEQTRFTFKKSKEHGKNNFFILSKREPDFKVRKITTGLWVEGLSSEKSDMNCVWKIIPVKSNISEGQGFYIASMKNCFFSAGSGGRIYVRGLMKEDHRNYLWRIENV